MKTTPVQRYVLGRLADGDRLKRYGQGWEWAAFPYGMVFRRTWGPLEASGLVNVDGEITAAGRAELDGLQL